MKELFCGGHHTFVFCEGDQIYCWGDNKYGQLGLEHNINQALPQRVQLNLEPDVHITQISCGGYHTIFLDNEGRVYVCGKNSDGQLGVYSRKSINKPKILDYFGDKYITDISCGFAHSVVLVDPSHVYVTGQGKHGQLGLENQSNKHYFTLNDALKGKYTEKIISGHSHTWFLLDYDDPYISEYQDPSLLLSQSGFEADTQEPNFTSSTRSLK